MEFERRAYLKAQDSRFGVYAGNFYGAVNWIPVDMVMKKEIGEETNQGLVGETNSIHRLPDEIIRHVFDKIPESKYLCNCSLVSKKFASIVLDTKKVSLEIPSWRPVCSCHPNPTIRRRPLSFWLGELFNFLSKPFQCVWWLLGYPFRKQEPHYPAVITAKPPAIRNFLKKFSSIESLSIDLSFAGVMTSPRYEPLLRWKCDKSGFVFVSAKTRELLSDDDEGALGDVENATRLASAEAFAELELVKYHFMDALWRLVFVDSILADFPCLKDVLVTDCMNQGRLVLDAEEILSIRDILKPMEDKVSCCVRVWHVPVVKLPSSGYVAKEATLCIFKEVGTDDDVLVENAFEEEYSELASAMVKKSSVHQIDISASVSDTDRRISIVIG